MKKGWKVALYSAICCLPIAFILAFSIPHGHYTHISCVGSSGVKPFVETLANDFSNQRDYSKYDVTTDAGGSGFGISQVAKGYTNIGNASKNPYEAVKQEYKQEWTNEKIKTLTFGWEAICIVFIPPKGLSENAINNINKILYIGENNITNLYRAFSGFNSGLGINTPNLGLFLNNEVDSPLTSNDQNILNNTTLIPYVRAGGSLTSGTAASFYDGSHFPNAHIGLTEQQQKAFSNGNYGNNFLVDDTDEANSRAWDSFSKTNKPGSCVYLSSGFIEQNKKLIEKKGYGIFAYKDVNQNKLYSYAVKDITDGFNFFRPLNMMFSLTNLDSPTIDFVKYILNNTLVPDKTIEALGARKVDAQDIESMSIGNNLWVSDYEIMINTPGQNPWSDGLIFGAKE